MDFNVIWSRIFHLWNHDWVFTQPRPFWDLQINRVRLDWNDKAGRGQGQRTIVSNSPVGEVKNEPQW